MYIFWLPSMGAFSKRKIVAVWTPPPNETGGCTQHASGKTSKMQPKSASGRIHRKNTRPVLINTKPETRDTQPLNDFATKNSINIHKRTYSINTNILNLKIQKQYNICLTNSHRKIPDTNFQLSHKINRRIPHDKITKLAIA